ncbi:MAG: hypothetical protein IKU68_03635 [Oscillospiraceae bacterium]|nr:hypothetical protein [Oscillospiraceae bacterium]
MEITPQCYIALCGGDMLSFGYFLPLPITNAILAVKPNFGYGGAECLRTVDIIEPQQQDSEKNQQENACCLHMSVLEYLQFVFAVLHLLDLREWAGCFGIFPIL